MPIFLFYILFFAVGYVADLSMKLAVSILKPLLQGGTLPQRKGFNITKPPWKVKINYYVEILKYFFNLKQNLDFYTFRQVSLIRLAVSMLHSRLILFLMMETNKFPETLKFGFELTWHIAWALVQLV